MERALKIGGGVAMVLWMAWITFQLHRIHERDMEICGIAFGKKPDGSLPMPLTCPEMGPGFNIRP
jgi:hypothetical protein